jgi:RNA recognition motif-containing protein
MEDEARLFADHFADQFSNLEVAEAAGNVQNSYYAQQQFVDTLSTQYGSDEGIGAVTSSTLFVGDLSITCTENDLVELFSQFIPKDHIASAHILRCRTTGTSLCYGFVTITSSSSDEETAIIRRELHGMYLFGRNLKLRSAKADFSMPSDDSGANNDDALYNYDLPKISIYVKFQATHISNNGHINEENIRQIFELSDETKGLICDTVDEEGADGAGCKDHINLAEKEKQRQKNLSNASIIDISIRKLAVDRVSGGYTVV